MLLKERVNKVAPLLLGVHFWTEAAALALGDASQSTYIRTGDSCVSRMWRAGPIGVESLSMGCCTEASVPSCLPVHHHSLITSAGHQGGWWLRDMVWKHRLSVHRDNSRAPVGQEVHHSVHLWPTSGKSCGCKPVIRKAVLLGQRTKLWGLGTSAIHLMLCVTAWLFPSYGQLGCWSI